MVATNTSFEERERPPPPRPTAALPGTEAKILVMAARYAAGFHLYHPADAKGGHEAVRQRERLLRMIHDYAASASGPVKAERN